MLSGFEVNQVSQENIDRLAFSSVKPHLNATVEAVKDDMALPHFWCNSGPGGPG